MLTVSMGALISLVIIMLICFVLPFALFYVLYRYADGRVKTLLLGAAAYIGCGVVLDTVIAALLDTMGGIHANAALYMLYAALLSPALFILVNYLVMKRFGSDNMKTTGDSMMYSLGYSTAFNVLSTGLVAIMFFLTLLDIRARGGSFLVVSDADYVSASSAVSASNLVNESVYREMEMLCGKPVSYYMLFIVSCLWAFAAYAAVMLVIWLAVRKTRKVILLALAYVIRLFLTLPDILDRFNVLTNPWSIQVCKIFVLVIVWVAAAFCRKTFIDTEDAQ